MDDRKTILYLECSAGISGDMMVAALLDLGADEKVLREVLDSIPAEGFSVQIRRVKKAGVDCCDFDVILDHDNHDHDMAYLHGDGECHEHHHGHESGHGHDGEGHAHQEHPHVHRGLTEIREILAGTKLTSHAGELAEKIFLILAEAEAKAHAVPVEQVHFHEVGAIDSIVDIVATAVCLDNLGIKDVVVPRICEGMGTVRCQHGILPVPVPATANIAEAHDLPLSILDTEGEFVTPTGAAIVAAVRTMGVLPVTFTIKKTGLGAGKRNYERPSILRAMLIETKEGEKPDRDRICKLETNVDDTTGEILGYVMDLLFEAGAWDVHYHPVYMKKNRPGWQLNVLCTEDRREELEKIMYQETTTIGIRHICMERSVLPREEILMQTGYGEIKVKKVSLPEGGARYYPEYESVADIARKRGIPFRDVFETVSQKGK